MQPRRLRYRKRITGAAWVEATLVMVWRVHGRGGLLGAVSGTVQVLTTTVLVDQQVPADQWERRRAYISPLVFGVVVGIGAAIITVWPASGVQ